jgi:hypothetical protein
MLPTGELIVLNVGNADSYSSYQCRVTHRLSGETRVSSGVARITVTEARAVTLPQFSDRSISIEVRRDELVVLPCIAEGHPPPEYRYRRLTITLINVLSKHFLSSMYNVLDSAAVRLARAFWIGPTLLQERPTFEPPASSNLRYAIKLH